MTESMKFDPMRLHCPHIPLFIGGDDAGNALRQAESDRINATTNRMLDTREVINRFTDAVRKAEKAPPHYQQAARPALRPEQGRPRQAAPQGPEGTQEPAAVPAAPLGGGKMAEGIPAPERVQGCEVCRGGV